MIGRTALIATALAGYGGRVSSLGPYPLQAGDQPLVVTTAWLAERLGDPRLIVFHVGDRAGYDASHLPRGETVVTYCHIGQQATVVWLAARLVGLRARLYDGSFQDWARRGELPVDPGRRPE